MVFKLYNKKALKVEESFNVVFDKIPKLSIDKDINDLEKKIVFGLEKLNL